MKTVQIPVIMLWILSVFTGIVIGTWIRLLLLK
jgi:hypothetical protein